MKKCINLVSIIFSFLTIAHLQTSCTYTKGLFIGSIQFPTTLEQVPSLRIFCAGNKIACEKDEVAKRITFTIPEDKQRTEFPLVIAEKVQFEVLEDSNTIKFLKVAPGQAYKLYTLERIRVAKESTEESNDRTLRKSHLYASIPESSYTYQWLIREEKNNLIDGKIPDDAIVVYFKPGYIQSVKGGSAFELPRIIIKADVAQLAGSEEKLHDFSKSLVLSSLDLNAIHANVQAQVTQEYHRTLITLVT
jgi:hypothetical protein